MSPIDCAYPDLILIGSDGRCMSTICPSRDDCDGVADAVIQQVIEANPDQLALLDEMEARISGLERTLSELKRAVALWCEGVDGGDRGPD